MVKLFSKDGCAPCKMVKQFLAYKDVKYTEYTTESDEYKELISKHGHLSTVPVLEVDNTLVLGYNPSRLTELLG